jgi:hypothetical protein
MHAFLVLHKNRALGEPFIILFNIENLLNGKTQPFMIGLCPMSWVVEAGQLPQAGPSHLLFTD